jgi:integrase
MSAAARNGYREAWVRFGNWCKRKSRLTANPFIGVPKADEKADPLRKRRALNENELRQLLKVAGLRPLAERGRETVSRDNDEQENKASRRGWTKAALTLDTIDAAAERARIVLADKPDMIADLEQLGRERALIYKTLVLTGLCKGELASLTVGQLELDSEPAYAVLHAADEKNRQGSGIPLRADRADDLRQWIADKLEAVRSEPIRIDAAIPVRLPADTPLFNVPTGLVRILNRDLQAAGIPKRDERDRTIDVHAMRHLWHAAKQRRYNPANRTSGYAA